MNNNFIINERPYKLVRNIRSTFQSEPIEPRLDAIYDPSEEINRALYSLRALVCY